MASLLSRIELAVCRTYPVSVSELRVTCSIDAAISLIDDTRLSVDAPTEAACVAVSLSDAVIWFKPLSVVSSERICASAPSET